MTQEHWMIAIAVWLLLGLLADKICEREARQRKERYTKTVFVVCYIVGPIILPIALCWAIIKGLVHLF